MPRHALILTAAALAAFGAFALAADAARPAAPSAPTALSGRFVELDRNRDGALDRSEVAAAPARLAERFERIDRNGDQRLEPAELRKAMQLAHARRDLAKAQREAMRARFAFLDTNGDRSLTLAEIGPDAPRLAQKFGVIDANRDGRIAADELRTHLQAERESRRAARAG
ncbi:MAG: EF-hand domain-containing protein [Silanimonas sp.]